MLVTLVNSKKKKLYLTTSFKFIPILYLLLKVICANNLVC